MLKGIDRRTKLSLFASRLKPAEAPRPAQRTQTYTTGSADPSTSFGEFEFGIDRDRFRADVRRWIRENVGGAEEELSDIDFEQVSNRRETFAGGCWC
jgi:hypothetical protein